MIITRTPLRISLGGGGTDIPSYYERDAGFVISVAIDKYVYITINGTFGEHHLLKYSEIERVVAVDEIQHPIIRESLKIFPPNQFLEIVSVADIPSGTGLGSSGSFTVGLLSALSAFNRLTATPDSIAQMACDIEISKLEQPVGKQDQYIAAHGGVMEMRFEQDGSVGVKPLAITTEDLCLLEDRLLLFYTGLIRSANAVLSDQDTLSKKGDESILKNLRAIKEIGFTVKHLLETGRLDEFGSMMNEHWQIKRQRPGGITSQEIDNIYAEGIKAGASGGKLVGAGAGGFVMFYASDPDRLRRAMSRIGIKEVRFRFDLDGTTVLTRG